MDIEDDDDLTRENEIVHCIGNGTGAGDVNGTNCARQYLLARTLKQQIRRDFASELGVDFYHSYRSFPAKILC